MARFVRFVGAPYVPARFTLDGVAGSFLSTEDINLLDADTAHMEQSIGEWVNNTTITGPTITQDVAPGFGVNVASFAARLNHATQRTLFTNDGGVNGFPVLPSTQYSWMQEMEYDPVASGDNAHLVRIVMRSFDGGGSSLGDDFIVNNVQWAPDTRIIFSGTFTTPATAAFLEVRWDDALSTGGRAEGDLFYMHKSCLRLGSDPTFVPSLRIVGVLDETRLPPALPIGFLSDGTPLQLGFLYAGDAVSYIRRDGVGGPVVCRFDPDDLPGGTGVVPDLTTWTDETGRTWTSNGGVSKTATDFGDSVSVDGLTIPDPMFIVKNPPAMLDEFDGDRWIVGAGWVGEGFTATLHDGTDATGPVVAEFDAEDVGL